MPKHTANYVRDLKVELEVTPVWWAELGGRRLSPNSPESADAIARAMLLAVGVFTTCEVRVSRSALKLVLLVPPDVTLSALTERAGQLRDRMNELVPA